MNTKPDIDEKKWRKLDTTIQCILNIIAIIIAQIVGGAWLDDSLIATIIVVSIFTCVKQFILGVIYNSVFLRKPFEKKGD